MRQRIFSKHGRVKNTPLPRQATPVGSSGASRKSLSTARIGRSVQGCLFQYFRKCQTLCMASHNIDNQRLVKSGHCFFMCPKKKNKKGAQCQKTGPLPKKHQNKPTKNKRDKCRIRASSKRLHENSFLKFVKKFHLQFHKKKKT